MLTKDYGCSFAIEALWFVLGQPDRSVLPPIGIRGCEDGHYFFMGEMTFVIIGQSTGLGVNIYWAITVKYMVDLIIVR